MKKQKVVSITAGNETELNKLLDEGWLVKKMISERVSTSSSHGYPPRSERGKIVFLLEKES